jgi:hypothetical protein
MIHRPQMLTSASPWLMWLQGMGTRAEDEGEDGPPPAGEEEAASAEAPFVAGRERCALLAAAASPIVFSVLLLWSCRLVEMRTVRWVGQCFIKHEGTG